MLHLSACKLQLLFCYYFSSLDSYNECCWVCFTMLVASLKKKDEINSFLLASLHLTTVHSLHNARLQRTLKHCFLFLKLHYCIVKAEKMQDPCKRSASLMILMQSFCATVQYRMASISMDQECAAPLHSLQRWRELCRAQLRLCMSSCRICWAQNDS